MLFEDVVKKYCSSESYEAKIASSRAALCKAEAYFPAGSKIQVLATYSKHMIVMNESGEVHRLKWSGDSVVKSELIETVILKDEFEQAKQKVLEGTANLSEVSIDKNRVFVEGIHGIVVSAPWKKKLDGMELSIKKVLGGKYKEIDSIHPATVGEAIDGLKALYEDLKLEPNSILSSMCEQVRKCYEWAQRIDQTTISVENTVKLLEDIVVLTKSVSMISAFVSAGHKF